GEGALRTSRGRSWRLTCARSAPSWATSPWPCWKIAERFDTVAVGVRAELLRRPVEADAAGAAVLAHRLKPSSRAVGALPLGAACEMLELTGGAGRSDRVAPLVAGVGDALHAALASMRRWRGAQVPAAEMPRWVL